MHFFSLPLVFSSVAILLLSTSSNLFFTIAFEDLDADSDGYPDIGEAGEEMVICADYFEENVLMEALQLHDHLLLECFIRKGANSTPMSNPNPNTLILTRTQP